MDSPSDSNGGEDQKEDKETTISTENFPSKHTEPGKSDVFPDHKEVEGFYHTTSLPSQLIVLLLRRSKLL